MAVESARQKPISRVLALTGETVAVESVVISAMVDGPIRFCPWREGDRVESGTDGPARLIEIDRPLYRAELDAAMASVQVARARLADLRAGTRTEEIAKARASVRQLEESTTFLRSDLGRIEKLAESGSLPGEALEKARVEYNVEEAKLGSARRQLEMLEAGATATAIAVQQALVEEAQAKLELARARLAECVIHAPFDGVITHVHARPGDMAAVKAPLLEMADHSSLVIRVAVPEARASTVARGMPARVTLDSLPGKTFEAKVERIFPELDRRMRTRTIEVVPTGSEGLMPGMFARVHLILEHRPEAITVTRSAIVEGPRSEATVALVQDGRIAWREVRVGIEQGDRVQVLEGLQAGERVAITGHEKLKTGTEVQSVEARKASGETAVSEENQESGERASSRTGRGPRS